MTKGDAKLLTQAQYARSRRARELPGGTREAVRKAVDQGRITAFGPDKLIDLALADSQWQRNTRARAGITTSSADVCMASAAAGPAGQAPERAAADPGYMQFRARREEADAQIAEMNAAKMRGTMVMREDVDRAMFEIGREVRDRLMACARRIAAEVASIQTAEGCETVIDREHRIVLAQLVQQFREKVGAPAKDGA